MNGFEKKPAAVLEKGLEQKKETDPVVKTEEQLLQESLQEVFLELEQYLAAQEASARAVSAVPVEKIKEEKPKTLEESLNEVVEELDKYLISEAESLKHAQAIKSGKKLETKELEKRKVLLKELKKLAFAKKDTLLKLRQELKNIDAKKDFSSEELKERSRVSYDEKSQSLFILNGDGSRKEVTFGDLVGDYDWGIKYAPDNSLPPRLWRKVGKTLALHETRAEIEKIFNKELDFIYGTGSPTTALGLEFINARFKKANQEFLIKGILAERMMVSFLNRAQYNNPELGMKVIRSNALEDTILKYDFKIIKKKRLGIALESEDVSRNEFAKNKRAIGIQLTLATKGGCKSKANKEAKRILPKYRDLIKENVDDIVVVRLPILNIFLDFYKRWINEGKPSGGPEQYLSREQKLAIFRKATKGLLNLSEDELQKLVI